MSPRPLAVCRFCCRAPPVRTATTVLGRIALTLDTYLDMETVSDPQLSPDGSQIIYTRGWIDKMNDTARVGALDHERRRQRATGSSSRAPARTGRRRRSHRATPRRASRKGSQIFVRWMDAEGATSQVTRVEQAPGAVAWSPDGTQLVLHACSSRIATRWPIKMPKAPAGAKWTEAPRIVARLQLPARPHGLHRQRLPPHLRRPGDRRHAAADHPRQPRPHRQPTGRRTARSILFSGLRADDADYQWRESEIYAVDVAIGRHQAAHDAQGPGRQPARLARRQARRLHRQRLDQRHLDRQQALRDEHRRLESAPGVGRLGSVAGRAALGRDGSALYFTAQNEGSQNLYDLPLAGPNAGEGRSRSRRGAHMLTVSDISPKGVAVGTLTSADHARRHRDVRPEDAGEHQAAHGRERRRARGQEARRGRTRSGTRRRTASGSRAGS